MGPRAPLSGLPLRKLHADERPGDRRSLCRADGDRAGGDARSREFDPVPLQYPPRHGRLEEPLLPSPALHAGRGQSELYNRGKYLAMGPAIASPATVRAMRWARSTGRAFTGRPAARRQGARDHRGGAGRGGLRCRQPDADLKDGFTPGFDVLAAPWPRWFRIRPRTGPMAISRRWRPISSASESRSGL